MYTIVRVDFTLQAITSNIETQGRKPELQLVELDTVSIPSKRRLNSVQ